MAPISFSVPTSPPTSLLSELAPEVFKGGLSNPESADFKKRRQLFETVNVLRNSGVGLILDVPQIAVVGSQSVGKSSLIEAISGITLPRASGTCTRCPIECTLSSSSNEWSCQVSLRFTVDDHGRALPETRLEKFGEPIKDKSEVKERIRRAQFAILNPKMNHLSYLNAPEGGIANSLDALSFSSNCIQVSISGKGVDDLSFVDLPGVIASVREDQDENDIKLVESLVKEHIKKPSCLILLVVSCETDLENQGARQLAKRINPSGERVIPVLTKPDRIPPGDEHSWLLLLRNQRERHKHGWYCVKQPSGEQMSNGMTWSEARAAEIEFFDEGDPWSSLDTSIRSRLGTVPLTKALGEDLLALIVKRLPELLREVDTNLVSCRKDLAELPARFIGDPIGEVWRLLANFKQDVNHLVTGRADDGKDGLMQRIRRARHDFREAIFQGAPRFKPYTRPSTGSESHRTRQDTAGGLEPEVNASGTVVYIDEVIERAETSITRELPYNYPYAVKVHYIKRFTAMWNRPAEDLFREMEGHFQRDLSSLVRKRFGSYAHGGLEGKINGVIIDHLNTCTKLARERMMHCIELESEEPTTSNEHYLSDYKAKYLARYRAERKVHSGGGVNGSLRDFINGAYDHSTPFNPNTSFASVLSCLQQMGFPPDLKKEDFLRLLKPDASEEALDIMAEARAYYQVAFKRFVDYVPMIIDFEMLKRFNRTIDDILFKELALGAENAHIRCKAFLDEAPEIINRRNDLSGKLVKLEAARLELQKALASSGIDPNAIELVRPESPMAPMAPYGATVHECGERAIYDTEPSAEEVVYTLRSESPVANMAPSGAAVHKWEECAIYDPEPSAEDATVHGWGKCAIYDTEPPPEEVVYDFRSESPVANMAPYGATEHGLETCAPPTIEWCEPVQPRTLMAHTAPYGPTVLSAFPSYSPANKKKKGKKALQ